MSLQGRGRRVRASRRSFAGLALVSGMLGSPAFAITQGQMAAPALHTRSAGEPDAASEAVDATGHTDLPPAAEGQYPWDKIGGIITLYFEDGKLHGYMTDPLSPDPHVAAPTLMFATTRVDGSALAWTTRQIHGRSFSFKGHLQRGPSTAPTLPGYYLLTGTLTQHGGQAGDVATPVSLKRNPAQP